MKVPSAMRRLSASCLLLGLLSAVSPGLAAQERQPAGAPMLPLPNARETRLYDVADLVEQDPWNPGAGDTEVERQARVSLRLDNLRSDMNRAILPSVKAENWSKAGPAIMVLKGTAQQHRAASEFLRWQRASKDSMYDLQCIWLRMPATIALANDLNRATQFLEQKEAKDLLAGLQKQQGVGLVTAPQTLTHIGVPVRMRVVREMAYVAGYEEVRVQAPTRATVLDPIVEKVDVGWWMDMRTRRSDEKHVSLTLEAKFQQVQEPFEVLHGPHGDYALPIVESTSFKSVLRLRHGSTAILPAMLVDGDAIVIMVSVKLISKEELEREADLDSSEGQQAEH